MTPGTALGFFWALEGMSTFNSAQEYASILLVAAAERRELYRFSCDLAKLALRIADKFGSESSMCLSCHCLICIQIT